MSASRRLSLWITLAVIFGAGAVVGMWIMRSQQPEIPTAQQPSEFKPLESGEAVVTRVYQRLSPTVVNIVAAKLMLNFWMQVVPQTGQGTGFVVDSKGHILTVHHVVGNAKDVEVTFQGGHKIKGHVVGRDPVSDLAVIKIKPFKGMQVAPLGDSTKLTVGQRVVAIGNPFGFQHTVTSGFISALDRDVTISDRVVRGMIQTDAAINPGNSGGPLISAHGDVIGINSAIYSQTGGFMGIGLAIPINRAKKVAEDIIRWGRAIYAWIGVKSWLDLNPRIIQVVGLPNVKGVLVEEVAKDSPASRAGLKGGSSYAIYNGRYLLSKGRPIVVGGDIILSADNKPTPTWDDYRDVILQKEVGETVKLVVLRDGKQLTLDVTLAADPRMNSGRQ